MVKGISKQVIVVHSQDRKMFDQAIFILSDEALKGDGITNDMLLSEAKRMIHSANKPSKSNPFGNRLLFTAMGAVLMGAVWLVTLIL